ARPPAASAGFSPPTARSGGWKPPTCPTTRWQADALLEQADGAGDDEGDGEQGYRGLDHHNEFGAAGEWEDVGGAEGGSVGVGQVEVVDEGGFPVWWALIGALSLGEGEVRVGVSSGESGDRAAAVELPVPQPEHDYVGDPDSR